MSDRYVVAGLARSRCRWFSELARWSNTSMAPIDYMKCLTVDEVRAVLGSGRQVSAVVVDAGVTQVDRELISLADETTTAVIVVSDPRVSRDWESLGASGILDDDFGPDELTELLVRHARPVDTAARRSTAMAVPTADPLETGLLIGVTGSGGSGTSTTAMALSQAMAGTQIGSVALVDGARSSDLAMYHDVGDVIPGLSELVDLHRGDTPDPEVVRELFFTIEDRGYKLLLGLRRPRDGASMGSVSTSAAISGIRRSFDLVVVDSDPWLDGESETGSIDIEDLHCIARSVAGSADLMIVVANPGLKGMKDLSHLVDRYAEFGLPRERILPVVSSVPRGQITRAAITRLVAEITSVDDARCPPPVLLRRVRYLEDVHNCATPLPRVLGEPLAKVVNNLIDSLGRRGARPEPKPVRATRFGDARSRVA